MATTCSRLELIFKKNCWNGNVTKSQSLTQGRHVHKTDSEDSKDGSHQRRNGPSITGGWSSDTCMSFSGSFSAAKKMPEVENALEEWDLQPRLLVHHGIPATAHVVACDPIQNMLAAATLDGRIKVFGNEGFEVLLESPAQVPINFLQFFTNQGLLVSINAQNNIEVWDLGTVTLVGSQTWETKVTASAIIQDSTFLYVGDASGTVNVLQYNLQKAEVSVMAYCITLHQTLGALATNFDACSVVGVMPHPSSEHERVLISYESGLSVLWSLHETEVIAVRGGTQSQLEAMSGIRNNLENGYSSMTQISSKEKQEGIKDLSCVCWACPKGNIFAAGYKDGDVWLWSISQTLQSKDFSDHREMTDVKYSCVPLSKIEMGSCLARAPITLLRWWTNEDSKHGKDGYLCAFGGKGTSSYDVIKIISLKDATSVKLKPSIELPLLGHVLDFLLLPSSTSSTSKTQSLLLVLKSQGQLCAYDTDEIYRSFKKLTDVNTLSSPTPASVDLPLMESRVTVAKMFLINRRGEMGNLLMEVPRILKSGLLYQLDEFNERYFIHRCKETKALVDEQSKRSYLYITGHANGSVNFWDLSTPCIFSVCCLETEGNGASHGPHLAASIPVSALDFCSISGLLAVGHQSGLISIYRLSCELSERSNNRSSDKGEERMQARLHFVSSFNQHQTSISGIVIASPCHRLAAGSENGIVSIIDLKTNVLLYHGRAFHSITSGIVSLNFVVVPMSGSGFSFFTSPTPPSSKKKQVGLALTQTLVLFVTTKDASMVPLDGNTGACRTSAPIKPKNSSTAISSQLIDASGIPVISTTGFSSRVLPETPLQKPGNNINSKDLGSVNCPEIPKVETLESGQNELTRAGPENIEDEVARAASHQYLLLLSSEDSLRMYYVSSLLKGVRSPSLKLRLHQPCSWTSTFQTPCDKVGVVLIYKTGQIELRCLPDLNILKTTSFDIFLKWQVKPDLSMLRTISCTVNGQIALIDHDRELLLLSILDEKHDLRLPVYSKSFSAEDVAMVTDIVGSKKNKKKRLLGRVIKEGRGGSVKTPDERITSPKVVDLDRLFIANSIASSPSYQPNDDFQSDCSSPFETKSSSLDIDDLDIEDEVSVSDSSRTSNRRSLMSKVKQTVTGKKKSQKPDPSNGSQHSDPSPLGHVRTLEEIKASYGQGKDQNVTRTAADMRDKLLRQRQKLRAINKRTAEMQEGAQDFHHMAEELVKALEEKKNKKFLPI